VTFGPAYAQEIRAAPFVSFDRANSVELILRSFLNAEKRFRYTPAAKYIANFLLEIFDEEQALQVFTHVVQNVLTTYFVVSSNDDLVIPHVCEVYCVVAGFTCHA
jgi:hypothetical protein